MTHARQHGFTLIEALVAILVFSIGVLALVGLQATAVSQSSQAKYRADASLLANELVGQMWIGDRTGGALKTRFEDGGTAYEAWLTRVQDTLPGASDTNTTVTVNAGTGEVTVVVGWKAPDEPAAAPAHNFTLLAQVR
jgi:type IV pilus assembly protein PilV